MARHQVWVRISRATDQFEYPDDSNVVRHVLLRGDYLASVRRPYYLIRHGNFEFYVVWDWPGVRKLSPLEILAAQAE